MKRLQGRESARGELEESSRKIRERSGSGPGRLLLTCGVDPSRFGRGSPLGPWSGTHFRDPHLTGRQGLAYCKLHMIMASRPFANDKHFDPEMGPILHLLCVFLRGAGSGRLPGCSKRRQDGLKSAPTGFKTAPRAFQEAPRQLQECSGRLQDSSGRASRAIQRLPDGSERLDYKTVHPEVAENSLKSCLGAPKNRSRPRSPPRQPPGGLQALRDQ